VVHGNPVNHLHDNNRFADTRAAEQTDLSSQHIRFKEINDFDARFEHLGFGALVFEAGRRPMNGIKLGGFYISEFIHRLSDNVHHPPEGFASYGDADGLAGIDRRHTAHHPVGGLHTAAANTVFSQVLLDFDADTEFLPAGVPLDPHAVIDRGKTFFIKLAVDHRPNYLYDFSNLCHLNSPAANQITNDEWRFSIRHSVEAAPLTTSISSLVIPAWRTLFA